MDREPDKQTMMLLELHLKKIKAAFAPEKILLFGSRAREDHLKDSDIDLLVVSKKFEGMPWRERIISVFGDWSEKQMLEPICFTPQEFEERKKQIGIVAQAVKEGVEL